MNITFIGGGNMARALVGGLIARGVASKALAVVEVDAEARSTVAARFGIATFPQVEPAAVVNADVIASGLSAFAPESAALAAGRVMLARIRDVASQRVNFAFETTLASRSVCAAAQSSAQIPPKSWSARWTRRMPRWPSMSPTNRAALACV